MCVKLNVYFIKPILCNSPINFSPNFLWLFLILFGFSHLLQSLDIVWVFPFLKGATKLIESREKLLDPGDFRLPAAAVEKSGKWKDSRPTVEQVFPTS